MPGSNQDFDIAGVTVQSALEWLRGERWAKFAADLDTRRCEVAFLNELGNRASWRAGCLKMVELFERGATAAIAHVTSPIVLRHYQKFGGVVTWEETVKWRGVTCQAWRVLIPPQGTRRWIEKVKGKTPDAKSKCL